MKYLFICLFFLIIFDVKASCEGCCVGHGGAVCLAGMTICKDKSPMSIECLDSNCNKCEQSEKKVSNKNIKEYPQNFKSFKEATRFLSKVYEKGGNTFFCNKPFKKVTEIRWRHIVPLNDSHSKAMKGDPINITAEKEKCFEVTMPRRSAKGDLVRIYRYLEERYKVSLVPPSKVNTFTIWAIEDPVNTLECQRILNHGNGKISGSYKELCKKE